MDLRDPELAKRIEKAVAEAEAGSSAEVVVVLAPRSDGYPELAAWAALAGFAAVLASAVWAPWVVHPGAAFAEAAVVALAVAWVMRRAPGPWIRWLPASRRARAVAGAAKVAFLDEHVTGTRDRTGLLVYASAAEGELVVIPDAGLASGPGIAHLNELSTRSRISRAPLEDRLLALLAGLGPVLAEAAPRRSDDRDELEDAPRIREVPP